MLCNWTWSPSDLEIRPMKLNSLRNLKIHVAISYMCMGRCMVIIHCSLCNLCFAFKAPKTQLRYMIMSLSLALKFLYFTDWCSYYYIHCTWTVDRMTCALYALCSTMLYYTSDIPLVLYDCSLKTWPTIACVSWLNKPIMKIWCRCRQSLQGMTRNWYSTAKFISFIIPYKI